MHVYCLMLIKIFSSRYLSIPYIAEFKELMSFINNENIRVKIPPPEGSKGILTSLVAFFNIQTFFIISG